MALKGINVIELVGLAPAPFCGLILSDFGANVIRVDRVKRGFEAAEPLTRGKKSISLDLKHDEGKKIFKSLCQNADVVIEPFRPGVMESLGLGPNILTTENKRLIYTRLSGFGQNGPMAKCAGHDINYVATSGVLDALGTVDKPIPPANLLADYAGGGLTSAFGILAAIIEREKSGIGQVIDANLLEGTAYVSTALFATRDKTRTLSSILWPQRNKRASNLLDGGASYYQTYQTKDGKFLAVGAIEAQFYERFLKGLSLSIEEHPQYEENWPKQHKLFASIIATKTQDEWMKIFTPLDCCVTPVVEIDRAQEYHHNRERGNFLSNNWPRPAPHLSRTPAIPNMTEPQFSEHSRQILQQLGYSSEQINTLCSNGVIGLSDDDRSKL